MTSKERLVLLKIRNWLQVAESLDHRIRRIKQVRILQMIIKLVGNDPG